ncbi:unnamed protein product [Staurois parvus]|uniref:Secreted protein n=1 Tax=Staurois parvus TaxID=386267 RepID=A0ABN9B5C0_9NEOB|nr:unnamed protein product [Staurois parvus]
MCNFAGSLRGHPPPLHYILTPLVVFLSVARGKVSAPQAVTPPSYTREYTAALLRDPSITYLVLRSRDVPPAVSPVMSSG